MKNKDYSIYGKIISVISNDYPPEISNKFTDNVMKKIYLENQSRLRNRSSSYLNIAASIFFAVITTYTLVSYNDMDNISTSTLSEESDIKENNLIRKVISKDPCKDMEKNDKYDSEKCK
tara:strand:+ start:4076 stop:4432 length:357 start_codon:yes stop_codon:yes gene_type:complete